jgi:exopolyphosphatase / guanosine-5'-triphosphate,3'-diphosphate pyrophosphatase
MATGPDRSATVPARPPSDISRVRARAPASRHRPLPIVRRACIDIGSNTTRLLVADCDGERLVEVHQERAFTHVRRALTPSEEIEAEKIDEVAAVVAGQLRRARELGAAEVLGVATAAIRNAANGDALVSAVRKTCGLEVAVLSAEEEARLAFTGAARTLGYAPAGPLGVVDVGGGSSELVVGTVPDRIDWYVSFPLGSGQLTDECLPSDPPSAEEIARAGKRISEALEGVQPPPTASVVAVGGSATSLRRIAGPLLDAGAFARVLTLLAAERASEVARRFELDADRVRLLSAGLLILQAAAERFGAPLEVGRGGLREGLLLEVADV